MKHFAVFLVIIVFAAFPAYSAEDAVGRAMKLYEMRHYEEAAAVLHAGLPSVEPAGQGGAYLTLGMVYLKNAELYRELYQEAVPAVQNYLKKLASAQGKGRSRFVDLYMGEALIETGKYGEAAGYLEKFSAGEDREPRYRAIAKARLGLSYHLGNEAQKASDLWAGIDTTDPEVKAELAAVYSWAGRADKDPVALLDESLAEAKKSGKLMSPRMVKNALSVLVRANLPEKGLDILKRADLKAFSYQEVLGKTKIITFYDLSLLGDIAAVYGKASIAYLEKAALAASVKDPAEYYLGEAYALFGSVDQSAKVAASFISASRMPQQYKDKIRAWQAANEYQKGSQNGAVGAWGELSRKQPLDPDLLAEVLFACARVKADCSAVLKRAEAAAETGQGKKFSPLNFALGKYYIVRKNQTKAISYMEAGRDKSNKNKFEANDPLMLVDLAGLYYRSKKFSEALEIYFEMSKQFPAVRQIQEAMQGVYAIEQKSAGDVKIF